MSGPILPAGNQAGQIRTVIDEDAGMMGPPVGGIQSKDLVTKPSDIPPPPDDGYYGPTDAYGKENQNLSVASPGKATPILDTLEQDQMEQQGLTNPTKNYTDEQWNVLNTAQKRRYIDIQHEMNIAMDNKNDTLLNSLVDELNTLQKKMNSVADNKKPVIEPPESMVGQIRAGQPNRGDFSMKSLLQILHDMEEDPFALDWDFFEKAMTGSAARIKHNAAGTGKPRANHKYVRRWWANGRWNYEYKNKPSVDKKDIGEIIEDIAHSEKRGRSNEFVSEGHEIDISNLKAPDKRKAKNARDAYLAAIKRLANKDKKVLKELQEPDEFGNTHHLITMPGKAESGQEFFLQPVKLKEVTEEAVNALLDEKPVSTRQARQLGIEVGNQFVSETLSRSYIDSVAKGINDFAAKRSLAFKMGNYSLMTTGFKDREKKFQLVETSTFKPFLENGQPIYFDSIKVGLKNLMYDKIVDLGGEATLQDIFPGIGKDIEKPETMVELFETGNIKYKAVRAGEDESFVLTPILSQLQIKMLMKELKPVLKNVVYQVTKFYHSESAVNEVKGQVETEVYRLLTMTRSPLKGLMCGYAPTDNNNLAGYIYKSLIAQGSPLRTLQNAQYQMGTISATETGDLVQVNNISKAEWSKTRLQEWKEKQESNLFSNSSMNNAKMLALTNQLFDIGSYDEALSFWQQNGDWCTAPNLQQTTVQAAPVSSFGSTTPLQALEEQESASERNAAIKEATEKFYEVIPSCMAKVKGDETQQKIAGAVMRSFATNMFNRDMDPTDKFGQMRQIITDHYPDMSLTGVDFQIQSYLKVFATNKQVQAVIKKVKELDVAKSQKAHWVNRIWKSKIREMYGTYSDAGMALSGLRKSLFCVCEDSYTWQSLVDSMALTGVMQKSQNKLDLFADFASVYTQFLSDPVIKSTLLVFGDN